MLSRTLLSRHGSLFQHILWYKFVYFSGCVGLRGEGAGQEGVLVSLIAFLVGLGFAFSLTLWVADVWMCTSIGGWDVKSCRQELARTSFAKGGLS